MPDFLSIESLHQYLPDRADVPSTPKSLPPEVNSGRVMVEQYADYCLRIIAAYVRTLKDGLELYRPLPTAERFHACRDRIRLFSGCLAGEQEIYDPVAGASRRVDSITSDFYVLADDGGLDVIAAATKPFVKGREALYEVTLSDGQSFRSTAGHRILTEAGYVAVSEAYERRLGCVADLPASSSELSRQESRAGDRRSMRKVQGSRGGYQSGRRLCDARLPGVQAAGQGSPPLRGDVLGRTPCGFFAGDLERIASNSRICRESDRPSSPYEVGLAWHLGLRLRSDISGKPSRLSSKSNSTAVRFRSTPPLPRSIASFGPAATRARRRELDGARSLAAGCLRLSTEKLQSGWQLPSLSCPPSPSELQLRDRTSWVERTIDRLCRDASARRRRHPARSRPAPRPVFASGRIRTGGRSGRGLAFIISMRFLRVDWYYDLTVPKYHNYKLIASGCFHHNSNQSGKTAGGCAEFARIARGMDPYKKRSDRDLIMIAVGKDQEHLGQVMWKKLWFPGLFEIVPDEVTGVWRSVRPDPNNPTAIDPIDLVRKELWQPSPPLMADQESGLKGSIVKLAWEKASESIPSYCVLDNGTEMSFYTSKGSPRAGIQIDLAWFDEEIISKDWFPETMPRLVRRNGIFMWTFTPQNSTPQAFDLHRRIVDGEQGISEFKLLIADNPYFSAEAKAALYQDLAAMGEEELSVRWFGNYAIHGRSVYPGYDLTLQGVPAFDIPEDWMCVAAVDPGTMHSAALFGAVPPDASELHVFNEIILQNKDAGYFAKEMKRVIGNRQYEAFVIDKQGGAQVSMGRTDRVCDHYSRELKAAGVPPSRLSGHGFLFGSNVVDARELSVKRLLGQRQLLFHMGRTYNLDRQIKNRFYDKNNPSRREMRTVHDAVDALEYLVAFFDESGLYYRKPAPPKGGDLAGYDLKVWQSWKKKSSKISG